MSLNNEPCVNRAIFIELDLVELSYYPYMISLEKCDGSCNAFDGLCIKVCVPSKMKDANVEVFNMITK